MKRRKGEMPGANRRTRGPDSTSKRKSRPKAAASFWQHRSADELAEEQGIGPVTDLGEVIGKGADLWANDEELEQFLAGIDDRRRRDRKP